VGGCTFLPFIFKTQASPFFFYPFPEKNYIFSSNIILKFPASFFDKCWREKIFNMACQSLENPWMHLAWYYC